MPTGGAILILDDDETTLDITAIYLTRNGFATLTSASAASALEKFHATDGAVRVLIANLTSPALGVVEIAAQLRTGSPGLKILFLLESSLEERYRHDEALLGLLSANNVGFLRKPYTEHELLAKLADLIDDATRAEYGGAIAVNPDDFAAKKVVSESEYPVGLLDLAHDAIIIRGLDGRIRYWNHGAETLYGWPRGQAVGKVAHELLQTVFPVSQKEVDKELDETRRWEGELNQTAIDKSIVIVSSRWVVRGQHSQMEILEINRDISAQKRVEAAFRGLNRELEIRIDELYRAEQMFRSLVESAPDALVIIDEAGSIVLVNAQTERLFGYSRDELLKQSVEMLMPARYRSRHRGHRAGYMSEPHVRAMGAGLELYGLRKNGEEFPAEISLSPIETGSDLLFCSAIRDLTERKSLEKMLRDKGL